MKKILYMLSLLIVILGLDRITKIAAVQELKMNEPIPYLGGLFQLTYHENNGAMLNLGSGLSDASRLIVFTVIVGIGLAAGLVYLIMKPMPRLSLTLALLIVGGGLGNLFDRVFNNGLVVDFMLLSAGPLRSGVFNIADIAIMMGAIGYVALNSPWGERLMRQRGAARVTQQ